MADERSYSDISGGSRNGYCVTNDFAIGPYADGCYINDGFPSFQDHYLDSCENISNQASCAICLDNTCSWIESDSSPLDENESYGGWNPNRIYKPPETDIGSAPAPFGSFEVYDANGLRDGGLYILNGSGEVGLIDSIQIDNAKLGYYYGGVQPTDDGWNYRFGTTNAGEGNSLSIINLPTGTTRVYIDFAPILAHEHAEGNAPFSISYQHCRTVGTNDFNENNYLGNDSGFMCPNLFIVGLDDYSNSYFYPDLGDTANPNAHAGENPSGGYYHPGYMEMYGTHQNKTIFIGDKPMDGSNPGGKKPGSSSNLPEGYPDRHYGHLKFNNDWNSGYDHIFNYEYQLGLGFQNTIPTGYETTVAIDIENIILGQDGNSYDFSENFTGWGGLRFHLANSTWWSTVFLQIGFYVHPDDNLPPGTLALQSEDPTYTPFDGSIELMTHNKGLWNKYHPDFRPTSIDNANKIIKNITPFGFFFEEIDAPSGYEDIPDEVFERKAFPTFTLMPKDTVGNCEVPMGATPTFVTVTHAFCQNGTLDDDIRCTCSDGSTFDDLGCNSDAGAWNYCDDWCFGKSTIPATTEQQDYCEFGTGYTLFDYDNPNSDVFYNLIYSGFSHGLMESYPFIDKEFYPSYRDSLYKEDFYDTYYGVHSPWATMGPDKPFEQHSVYGNQRCNNFSAGAGDGPYDCVEFGTPTREINQNTFDIDPFQGEASDWFHTDQPGGFPVENMDHPSIQSNNPELFDVVVIPDPMRVYLAGGSQVSVGIYDESGNFTGTNDSTQYIPAGELFEDYFGNNTGLNNVNSATYPGKYLTIQIVPKRGKSGTGSFTIRYQNYGIQKKGLTPIQDEGGSSYSWVEKTTQLSHRKHLEETWTVEISPPDYFTFENFPLTLEYPIHNNYIRYSLPHYGLDTTWEQVKSEPLNGTFVESPTPVGPILTSEYVNTEEELTNVGEMIGCKSLFPIRSIKAKYTGIGQISFTDVSGTNASTDDYGWTILGEGTQIQTPEDTFQKTKKSLVDELYEFYQVGFNQCSLYYPAGSSNTNECELPYIYDSEIVLPVTHGVTPHCNPYSSPFWHADANDDSSPRTDRDIFFINWGSAQDYSTDYPGQAHGCLTKFACQYYFQTKYSNADEICEELAWVELFDRPEMTTGENQRIVAPGAEMWYHPNLPNFGSPSGDPLMGDILPSDVGYGIGIPYHDIMSLSPYFGGAEESITVESLYFHKFDFTYTPNQFYAGVDAYLTWVCDSGFDDPITNGVIEYNPYSYYATYPIEVTYNEIGYGFGYDEDLNIDIEQSLLNSYDPYSGIDFYGISYIENDEEVMKAVDYDGRPSLGLFYYDNINSLKDNFSSFLVEPFEQLEKINLITNGDGKYLLYEEEDFSEDFGGGYLNPPQLTLNYSPLNFQSGSFPANVYGGEHWRGYPTVTLSNGAYVGLNYEIVNSNENLYNPPQGNLLYGRANYLSDKNYQNRDLSQILRKPNETFGGNSIEPVDLYIPVGDWSYLNLTGSITYPDRYEETTLGATTPPYLELMDYGIIKEDYQQHISTDAIEELVTLETSVCNDVLIGLGIGNQTGHSCQCVCSNGNTTQLAAVEGYECNDNICIEPCEEYCDEFTTYEQGESFTSDNPLDYGRTYDKSAELYTGYYSYFTPMSQMKEGNKVVSATTSDIGSLVPCRFEFKGSERTYGTPSNQTTYNRWVLAQPDDLSTVNEGEGVNGTCGDFDGSEPGSVEGEVCVGYKTPPSETIVVGARAFGEYGSARCVNPVKFFLEWDDGGSPGLGNLTPGNIPCGCNLSDYPYAQSTPNNPNLGYSHYEYASYACNHYDGGSHGIHSDSRYQDGYCQTNTDAPFGTSGYAQYCTFVGDLANAVGESLGVGQQYRCLGVVPPLKEVPSTFEENPYDTIITSNNMLTERELKRQLPWARWVKTGECLSHGRCLEFDYFKPPHSLTETERELREEYQIDLFRSIYIENKPYRTLNQSQILTQPEVENQKVSVQGFSSLRVSFYMKTTYYDGDEFPIIEAGIQNENSPSSKYPSSGDWRDNNKDIMNTPGNYNSRNPLITSISDVDRPLEDLTKKNPSGGLGRFQNKKLDTWEKMEFTFNLTDQHINAEGIVKGLYFMIQYGGSTTDVYDGPFMGEKRYGGIPPYGRVLLDNFSVIEGYDFTPDVDVRSKKGENIYGEGNLTKYYDPFIYEQLQSYNDSIAPLEASFYFYPRFNSDDIFDVQRPIIFNDFRNGLFYLYDIDWGDGSPPEFLSEPEKIDNNKMIYHTYENSGIYEITGTMIRMRPNNDLVEMGIQSSRKFLLRININEGLDEDFTYFGSDGFSFIPYKNTLPVIGGINKESIYYKSIKRQLGFISDDIKTQVQFKKESDKLKTEHALSKMESGVSSLNLLSEFKKLRYVEPEDRIVTPLHAYLNNMFVGNGRSEYQGWVADNSLAPQHLSEGDIFNALYTPIRFEDASNGLNVRYNITKLVGNTNLFLAYNAKDRIEELPRYGGTPIRYGDFNNIELYDSSVDGATPSLFHLNITSVIAEEQIPYNAGYGYLIAEHGFNETPANAAQATADKYCEIKSSGVALSYEVGTIPAWVGGTDPVTWEGLSNQDGSSGEGWYYHYCGNQNEYCTNPDNTFVEYGGNTWVAMSTAPTTEFDVDGDQVVHDTNAKAFTSILCSSSPDDSVCSCPELSLLDDEHPCTQNYNHCDLYTSDSCPPECHRNNYNGEEYVFAFYIRFNEIQSDTPIEYTVRPANCVDDYLLEDSNSITTGFNASVRTFNTEEITQNINEGSPWIRVELSRNLINNYATTEYKTDASDESVFDLIRTASFPRLEFISNDLLDANQDTIHGEIESQKLIDFDIKEIFIEKRANWDEYTNMIYSTDYNDSDSIRTEIYTGKLYSDLSEELGHSFGDSDISNIRYFNKPMEMWEMLGFTNLDPNYLNDLTPPQFQPEDEDWPCPSCNSDCFSSNEWGLWYWNFESNIWELDPFGESPSQPGLSNGEIVVNNSGTWSWNLNDFIWDYVMPICGCTNSLACNFDITATIDNGSCQEPPGTCDCEGNVLQGFCDCEGTQPQGICDCDGNIPSGVGYYLYCDCNGTRPIDLYGVGYVDCDGNCLNDEDNDGICDEVDECVGQVDVCGICNGPGITEGCDCDGNVLDACGICGGEIFTSEDCESFFYEFGYYGSCCDCQHNPNGGASLYTLSDCQDAGFDCLDPSNLVGDALPGYPPTTSCGFTADEACNKFQTMNLGHGVIVDACTCYEPILFYDCAGECGGSAVIDECGVCNGPGVYEDGCCYEEMRGCDGQCGTVAPGPNQALRLDCNGQCPILANGTPNPDAINQDLYPNVCQGPAPGFFGPEGYWPDVNPGADENNFYGPGCDDCGVCGGIGPVVWCDETNGGNGGYVCSVNECNIITSGASSEIWLLGQETGSPEPTENFINENYNCCDPVTWCKHYFQNIAPISQEFDPSDAEQFQICRERFLSHYPEVWGGYVAYTLVCNEGGATGSSQTGNEFLDLTILENTLGSCVYITTGHSDHEVGCDQYDEPEWIQTRYSPFDPNYADENIDGNEGPYIPAGSSGYRYWWWNIDVDTPQILGQNDIDAFAMSPVDNIYCWNAPPRYGGERWIPTMSSPYLGDPYVNGWATAICSELRIADNLTCQNFGEECCGTDEDDGRRGTEKSVEIDERHGRRAYIEEPNHPNNPSSPRYWKNIIPEDYSIYRRQGIFPPQSNYFISNIDVMPYWFEQFDITGDGFISVFDYTQWQSLGRQDIAEKVNEIIISNILPPKFTETPKLDYIAELNVHQNWLDNNEYNNIYYYPVLPKYSAAGEFSFEAYAQIFDADNFKYSDKFQFPMEGPATNKDFYHPNLKLSIGDTLVDDNVFGDDSGNNNKSFSVSDYKPKFDKETFEIKKVTRTGRLRTNKKNRAF